MFKKLDMNFSPDKFTSAYLHNFLSMKFFISTKDFEDIGVFKKLLILKKFGYL